MMKTLACIAVAMLFFLACSVPEPLSACTDVLLRPDSVFVVSGRNMDFALDLQTTLLVVPRETSFQSRLGKDTKGLSWTSRYGFVGLNALGQDFFADGMNEKGLSAATLWLPGTEYPDVTEAEKTLAVEDAVSWILGNFSTVEEVKDALKNVTITGVFLEAMKTLPPLHIAVHDVQGKSIVIEFLGGQTYIHDNTLGVLTNAPDFDWQLTNYQLFLWQVEDLLYPAAVAVPGAWTPAPRFVRAAMIRQQLPTPTTHQEALASVIHIMNSVQVPKGAYGTDTRNEQNMAHNGQDYTQYTLIRDHEKLILYFNTWSNQGWRSLDLKSIDFSGKTKYAALSVETGPANSPVKFLIK